MLTTDLSRTLPVAESRAGVEVRRFRGLAPQAGLLLLAANLHDDRARRLGHRPCAELPDIRRPPRDARCSARRLALRRHLPPRRPLLAAARGDHTDSAQAARAAASAGLPRSLSRARRNAGRSPASARARPVGAHTQRRSFPRTAAVASAVRDPDLIASPGRLERYKGHDRVIAALPHILAHRPGGAGSSSRAAARRRARCERLPSASVSLTRSIFMHFRYTSGSEWRKRSPKSSSW